MKAVRLYQPGLPVAAFALAVAMAVAPSAAAEPIDEATPDPGSSAPVDAVIHAPVNASVPVQTADPSSPSALACTQFGAALDGASLYYGQFADTIDGYQRPDYSDPTVSDTNTLGRTALRQAAALAMTSANTPGLHPDIAAPMRAWSLDATKLLLKMGLRGGGETLNVTATELNQDAGAAQMACAAVGAVA